MRRMIPFLALTLLSGACDKETKPLTPTDRNFPPEIRSMEAQVERALVCEEIQVNCGARDRDADPLGYRWTATAGTFPGGISQAIVKWKSPPSMETQTLTVCVTDVTDTVYADLEIQLHGVAPPGSLSFINGVRLVDLTWKPCIDEVKDGWTGYEVYRSSRSLVDLPVDSLLPYRLTTVPVTRRQFRVLGITPGEKAYYQIRSRRDYEGVVEISEEGPEIDTASRLRGFGVSPLFEIESRRGAKGVRISDGSIHPIDSGPASGIDLYLGTTDPEDGEGNLLFKSASRLSYRDPAWADRETGIKQVESDWGTPIAPENGYTDLVPVTPGSIYAIRTADGHYAKLQVSELRGAPPERRVEFQWAWQPIPDYPRY